MAYSCQFRSVGWSVEHVITRLWVQIPSGLICYLFHFFLNDSSIELQLLLDLLLTQLWMEEETGPGSEHFLITLISGPCTQSHPSQHHNTSSQSAEVHFTKGFLVFTYCNPVLDAEIVGLHSSQPPSGITYSHRLQNVDCRSPIGLNIFWIQDMPVSSRTFKMFVTLTYVIGSGALWVRKI